jgi:hypothetical protein
MLTDAQVAEALDRLIRDIEAPLIPLAAIRNQLERPKTAVQSKPRRDLRFSLAAAAVVVGIVLAVSSHSLVQAVAPGP